MPEKGWRSVSLPSDLIKEIEVVVEKVAAYTSVSEFVRAAVVRRFEELEKEAG